MRCVRRRACAVASRLLVLRVIHKCAFKLSCNVASRPLLLVDLQSLLPKMCAFEHCCSIVSRHLAGGLLQQLTTRRACKQHCSVASRHMLDALRQLARCACEQTIAMLPLGTCWTLSDSSHGASVRKQLQCCLQAPAGRDQSARRQSQASQWLGSSAEGPLHYTTYVAQKFGLISF